MILALLLTSLLAEAATGLPTVKNTSGTRTTTSTSGSLPCVPITSCMSSQIEADGPNGELPPDLLIFLGLGDRTDLGYIMTDTVVAGMSTHVDLVYGVDESGTPLLDDGMWLIGSMDLNADGYADPFGGPFTFDTAGALSTDLAVFLGDAEGRFNVDAPFYLHIDASEQAWGSTAGAGFVWQIDAITLADSGNYRFFRDYSRALTIDMAWAEGFFESGWAVDGDAYAWQAIEWATETAASRFSTSAQIGRGTGSAMDGWSYETASAASAGSFAGLGTDGRYRLRSVVELTEGDITTTEITRERGTTESALTLTRLYVTGYELTGASTKSGSTLDFAAFPYARDEGSSVWDDVASALDGYATGVE